MSPWIYVPLLTIGIGGPCLLLYRWFIKPPRLDAADKVSAAWLDDHKDTSRYTNGGK